MTLDDLTKIYRDEIAKPEYPGWDEKHRAGIRAVVTALRDHLKTEAPNWSHGWGIIEIENEIDEILAPREGDKP